MKKTYIQPAILLTKVAMQQFICGSEKAPISDDTVNNVNDLQSRRGGLWDDED